MAHYFLPIKLFLIFLVSLTSSSSILEWLGWSSNAPLPSTVHVQDGVPLISIPFEELSPEEKFLQEAQKYTSIQLSELDSCQHKLIMKIQTSCSGITEEDLAKLSVQLLNCQSQIEDRKIYPCTEKMSLKECTSSMDSNTWNAYHLMNNRARAVCYAARQQQFRALSEMTVNKLMATAHKQLQSMDQLREVQKQLGDAATETLASMADGQKELIEQQATLRVTQNHIKDAIMHNFNQLQHERALINAGHKELSEMTKELGDKLDSAQRQLQDQNLSSQENHQQVIHDLETITLRADRIWHRIDESTKQLLQQQKITAVRYEETLRNLERINMTVTYLLDMLENTRSELDLRLRWITDIVGGTGEQLDKTMLLVQHTVYLILGMIVAVFLQTSVLTRLSLLVLVFGNVVLLYKLPSAYEVLNFTTLTICIVTIMMGEWIFSFLYKKWLLKYSIPDKTIERFQTQNLFSRFFQMFNTILKKKNDSVYKNNSQVQHIPEHSSEIIEDQETSEEDEDYISYSHKVTNGYNSFHQRISSFSSTPERNGYMREVQTRGFCKSLCRNGQRCRNTVSRDEVYCFRHAKYSTL